MHRRKSALLIITFFLISFLYGCGTQSGQDIPKLVIGYDICYPYNYVDEDGDPSGICVEIAREACRRMGYEPFFKEIEWDEKDTDLENGEIDCVWGCFSMNGRENEYSWIGPYMYSNQVVAVLENSEIRSLADLEGKRVAVKAAAQPESIFLERPDNRIPQVGAVYCLTEMDEVVTALRNDYVDACAGYYATLLSLLKKTDVQYRFLDDVLMRSRVGIAFLKGDNSEVRKELTVVLQEMLEDGTMKQILEAYGLDSEKALGGIRIE
jgi:polar amino acid transport system substrate-binding protein